MSNRYTYSLHFKVPFLDTVQKYPSRLYTYVSDSEVVNTAEKKQYYVKTYAQWSIADPALFSLSWAACPAPKTSWIT